MSRVTEQYEQACKYLAGGVSASTRLNRALGQPMLFDRADGCRVWDLDGREYIDLCCSHGATLLGHGDMRVRHAVERVLARGAACSYENELHTELARLLCETIPCCERVRFTGSGTRGDHALPAPGAGLHRPHEAAQVRGQFPRLSRPGDVRHRHAGRPARPRGRADAVIPARPACPPGSTRTSSSCRTTGPTCWKPRFAQHGRELAAVICEPIYYNAGCIMPTPEFLTALRRLTREHGVLLIFDEVLSAFRMAPGGAQEYLGVTPDLCTLGKAVGGGFPLSVFGGRRDIMDRLMPQGDCQHSGTYNGHLVAVAAGLAAVTAYRQPGFYDHIHAVAERLYRGLNELFARHGVDGPRAGLGGALRHLLRRDGADPQLPRRRAAPARADAALHRRRHRSTASTSTTTAARPAITASARR